MSLVSFFKSLCFPCFVILQMAKLRITTAYQSIPIQYGASNLDGRGIMIRSSIPQYWQQRSDQHKLSSRNPLPMTLTNVEDDTETGEELAEAKMSVFKLIGAPGRNVLPETIDEKDGNRKTSGYDQVLACPETKKPVKILLAGPAINTNENGIKVSLVPDDSLKKYTGRTDSYLNLLRASLDKVDDGTNSLDEEGDSQILIGSKVATSVLNNLRVFVPPPLRTILGADSYVPMRDLFTSPFVSYAYERGWRQNFNAAGFPGIQKEFEMVQDFFRPATIGSGKSVVVDMSCATGLMTRRLANCGEYSRVIGCDYSDSMLLEARRRISADPELSTSGKEATKLDLVRCDVAEIPMLDQSVNALHAGAAMHCWPEVQDGLNEIYRVLKPGGRFFATTFLSEYFRVVQASEGGSSGTSSQAFQYFESTDQLREMMLNAGFHEDNVDIQILGAACVVMKCEK